MSFASAYPHLWEAILAAAPYPALLRLRATSRGVRDAVDSLLCAHLAVRLGPSPDQEVRCVRDGALRRLPTDWLAHADAVRTLSLIPATRFVSPDNAADLGLSFTPTRGDVWWAIERIWMGETFDRLEALSGTPAGNAAAHEEAWGSPDCWCGARRGQPTPLLAQLGQLRLHRLRSWGMHVCGVPIRAERVVFHSLPAAEGTHSPPITLVATVSRDGGDIPGIAPWQSAGPRAKSDKRKDEWRVTHSAIRLSGPHPRVESAWAIGSVLMSLVAPLLRRGVRVTLLDYDEWPHVEIACGMWGDVIECPREAFQVGLAKWMRWNARLVEQHVGFTQDGEMEEWCIAPEW